MNRVQLTAGQQAANRLRSTHINSHTPDNYGLVPPGVGHSPRWPSKFLLAAAFNPHPPSNFCCSRSKTLSTLLLLDYLKNNIRPLQAKPSTTGCRDWVCSGQGSGTFVKIAISDSFLWEAGLFMFSWHSPLFVCYCLGFPGTDWCTHTNANKDDAYLWCTALHYKHLQCELVTPEYFQRNYIFF